MALVAYFSDPQFAMYTAQLLNVTTKQMEVEVEDFSASVLYLAASASTALFAAASRNRTNLDADTHYSMETLQEMPMWDLSFWTAQLLQHGCLVAFMCSPLDWYFLAARGFGHVAAAAPDLAAAVGERGAVEGEHSDAAVRNALLHALHRRPAARARGVLHGHAVSGRPAAHRAHVRPGSEYAGRGQLQAVLLRGDERGADGELQRGVLSREQIS
eukprot:CAMPEP_0172162244 /NCGR_PEP_ID=MMETSP1050-20130122/6562_1 /TAXON_ID=233186 /ORGANISM="Cryptomonas curvata, Strain CCAP979/52" /LENGTH=214 /DNA_ID=CAMNT_0012832209 /DNA_START=551 /DNA_END=1194 /DNA_ORIENTATION=-